MDSFQETLVCVLFLDQCRSLENVIKELEAALHAQKVVGTELKILEQRVLASKGLPRVVEVKLQQSGLSLEAARRKAFTAQVEQDLNAQLVVRSDNEPMKDLRLAVFDMDSTLIQQEVIDLLASKAGVEASVGSITARAMNGELDFAASLRERVALLKGIPTTVWEDLKPAITFTPGAEALLNHLRILGVKTAMLSGGFMPLATHVAKLLSIDHVHANELASEAGRLTGQLADDCIIVDAERKRTLLRSIADTEGILEESSVLAVGDGANDLLMLSAAGTGIAVNAKPKVQELAPSKLNCQSLLDILYFFGLAEEDIKTPL